MAKTLNELNVDHENMDKKYEALKDDVDSALNKIKQVDDRLTDEIAYSLRLEERIVELEIPWYRKIF